MSNSENSHNNSVSPGLDTPSRGPHHPHAETYAKVDPAPVNRNPPAMPQESMNASVPPVTNPMANRGHGDHESLHFLSSARGEQEFDAAQRHSGMVRRLRIILPVAGIIIIAGFVAVLFMRTIGVDEISIGDIGLEKGKLVMANPQLTGTDSEHRPYSMKAARALQDVKNPSDVTLESIDAYLQVSADNSAHLTAGSGFYNTESQKLTLGDEVKLKTEDGMSIATKEADIDIPNGTFKSDFPVEIISPKASISADTLRVENKGEKIIFEKRVSLTIYPGAFERGDEAATASTQN